MKLLKAARPAEWTPAFSCRPLSVGSQLSWRRIGTRNEGAHGPDGEPGYVSRTW